MEKLVLFGGTFDPVHNGHLRIARFASLKLNADVVFIPAKSPRWKQPNANIYDRHKMLHIALKKEGTGSVYISKYEIESKDEVNYSIDTVKYFVNKFKNRQIVLLIGGDQVESFHKWKDAEKIAELSNIIYVIRPDVKIDNDNVSKFKMERLEYDGSGTISSSKIRNLLELDTPKEVIDYIAEHQLYYFDLLKKYYTEKRLTHAISVANVAYSIAKNNNDIVNAGDAYIAGLLHDIGKNIDKDEQRNIMNTYFKDYSINLPPNLYHQFVGAYIAKMKLGITNQSIIDAIMFHATGKAHMTPLSKIIYSADKVDPLRGYDSKKLIKTCVKNYYEGFNLVLKENKKYLIEKGFNINNPLTEACMKLYLGE